MMERGLIAQNLGVRPREAENYCEFHDQKDHEIQKCSEFRALLQGLMDNKELEFFKYVGSPEKTDVCASEEGSMKGVYKANHPVVIISRPRMNEVGAQVAPKVVIHKPVAFPYKDSKRVPWNYSCNVTFPGEETPINASKEAQDEGFYTRSGKRYTPSTKVEQHSEYSVVEQLHKQPKQILVIGLTFKLKPIAIALMKVLKETYAANDISVNKMDRLVNNISADNFIFFNDDEVPPGGRGLTKALHITTRCKGYTLPGVLIDNGSALNVLPLSTLMRAFDGTERKVMGKIEVPLLIWPSTYEVDFLVMDIKPSYNCLLGRPWIHSAGAVPSSLHQKLKLVTESQLVTINAEEDIIATITSDAPYLEANDEAIECSFRSLEFVNATFIAEENKILIPRLSETTRMGLRLTIGKGALPGRGLGRYLQGRINIPMTKDKQDRVIHSERKTSRKKILEEMMESLDINTTYEEGTGVENLSGIRPYEPGSVLNNWNVEEISTPHQRRIQASLAKASKDETRCVVENKRGGQEAIRCWFPTSG
ncbi:uncharacterized protein LOC128283824 [Gossypium arboreum]|uniref:uncharacterized protein LOC128283824 n=1 Tax=Gossypium arboreum TaxID=29729 RepID=UPI0022F1BF69|nr:uncharacterized protein LOC128283824 [Gossypium arboreum]